MTKILIPNSGWVYLHVLIDWGSKKIIGHSLESTSRTDDWLSALHMGINNQFPNGIKEANPYLQLVLDNGCQPTSKRFISECKSLGIQQIFTSYNNPKGNADTERVIRTIKEELVWPREWKDIYELKEELTKWIQNYNEDFPHSSFGYMTPYDYEAWFNASLVA